MIPIGDTVGQPQRSFPAVTLLLIAANVAVFALELAIGTGLPRFIQSFGLVPAEISSGRDLSPPSPSPIYLTLLTAMFIHGGFLHLGGNMLFLWVFGDNVEDALGHLGYLGFYLLCGVGASLVHILVDPFSRVPSVGASGAIAGVLAAYLLLFPNATVRTLLFIGPFITVTRISAFFMIGVWIVFQLVSALVELGAAGGDGSGVAFWAHVGGFAVGLVAIAIWKGIGSRE